MTVYLTVVEVLAIHADQIERYGGAHGVRDPGLLESALYRPQTGYYADLIEEAALWESLAQNHPFIDGNKRAAFAATYTFLAANASWTRWPRSTSSAGSTGSGRSNSRGLPHGCAATCVLGTQSPGLEGHPFDTAPARADDGGVHSRGDRRCPT